MEDHENSGPSSPSSPSSPSGPSDPSGPSEPKDLPPKVPEAKKARPARYRNRSASVSVRPAITATNTPAPVSTQRSGDSSSENISALAELGRIYGWAPLRAPLSLTSPNGASGKPAIAGPVVTPGGSADRLQQIHYTVVTPVSPRITSPPDVRGSHKKEKLGFRKSDDDVQQTPVKKGRKGKGSTLGE